VVDRIIFIFQFPDSATGRFINENSRITGKCEIWNRRVGSYVPSTKYYLPATASAILMTMALFQKNPFSLTDHKPLYTLGSEKTILIVGLGNPGKKYEGTRHNIGFECLNAFVSDSDEMSDWILKKDLKCEISNGMMADTRVIAVKPNTFMNLSGEAVQAVSHFYKIQPQQIVVVHDELDIPYGQIRTRNGGGAAGHKGVKSLIQHIGEECDRIRIGINGAKPLSMESADYVLEHFSKAEAEHIAGLKKEVIAILTEYVYSGSLTPTTYDFIS
jgi:peptidyl-tRNA hydrolase, PTH1 family